MTSSSTSIRSTKKHAPSKKKTKAPAAYSTGIPGHLYMAHIGRVFPWMVKPHADQYAKGMRWHVSAMGLRRKHPDGICDLYVDRYFRTRREAMNEVRRLIGLGERWYRTQWKLREAQRADA